MGYIIAYLGGANRLACQLNFTFNSAKWTLHWEWLPNSEYDIDFAKYVKFTKNFETQFVERILYLIKVFETDSELMTKMNNYLNEKNS